MEHKDKDKRDEYAKQYYQANKEKIREQRKQYREANKEKIREYYQANKEKISQQKKTNSEIINAKRAIRMQTGLSIIDVPNELIELKKLNLKLKQLIKG